MDNLGKYVYAEQKRQEGTGYMKQQTVYLKCDRSAEVQAQDVFLKDVAEIRCQDPVLQAKTKSHQNLSFSQGRRKTMCDQLSETGKSYGRNLSGDRCAGGWRDRCAGGMDLCEQTQKQP